MNFREKYQPVQNSARAPGGLLSCCRRSSIAVYKELLPAWCCVLLRNFQVLQMTVISVRAILRTSFIIWSLETNTVHMDGARLIFVTQRNDWMKTERKERRKRRRVDLWSYSKMSQQNSIILKASVPAPHPQLWPQTSITSPLLMGITSAPHKYIL